MAIDLDDPSTWPTDNTELLKIADTGVIDDDDDSEDSEGAADTAAAETPKETSTTTTATSAETPELDILAVDGKNVIPHHVLKETRNSLRETKAALAQAQQELQTLKTTAPATITTASPPSLVDGTMPDEVVEKIAKLTEDWGSEIAEQYEKMWRLEQTALQQQAVIAKLNQQIEQQQQVKAQSEQEAIEEAIAASPQLDKWARDKEDQSWFERALQVHKTLLQTDVRYTRMNWFDRMRELPKRTMALYGAAPETAEVPEKPATQAAQKVARDKAKSALNAPPTSLTDVTGDFPPDRSELEKIEDLKGNALTAYLHKLASDPKKFDAYMRSIS